MKIYHIPLTPEEAEERLRDAESLDRTGWDIARALHDLAWHGTGMVLTPTAQPAPMFIRMAARLKADPSTREALRDLLTELTR